MNRIGLCVVFSSVIMLFGGIATQAQEEQIGNGKIAFASNLGGDYEIFTIEPDGTDLIQLTNNRASDLRPDWSPDGTRIVFQSDQDGLADIFVMNADGSQQVNLTQDSSIGYFSPSWSPDGTQIAFSRGNQTGEDVFIMNSDGSNIQQITSRNDALFHLLPTWSPDGQSILVSATNDRGGILSDSSPIYTFRVIDLATGQQSDIYQSGVEDPPDWSWVRNEIIFSDVGFSNYIRIISDSGSIVKTVTQEPDPNSEISLSNEYPSWSPDGTMLTYGAYISTPQDRVNTDYDIYITNPDGTGKLRLTIGNGADDIQPDWQPVTVIVSLAPLRLTSLCSPDPDSIRVWRVRNTNPDPVNFTWDVFGTDQTGSGTVPGGSEATPGEVTFQTVAVDGPNTTRLFVNGEEQDVKASTPDACTVAEPAIIPHTP